MLFTPYNAQAVMNGLKTQTRRPVKPGEFGACVTSNGKGRHLEIYAVWVETKAPFHKPGELIRAPLTILERMNRLKWVRADGFFADKTYAVQPGRGKLSIGRIQITTIRKERVQNISEYDAEKEGIEVSHYYCDEGTDLDPTPIHRCDPIGKFRELWDSIYGPGLRWADNPEVWVLEFKSVGIISSPVES